MISKQFWVDVKGKILQPLTFNGNIVSPPTHDLEQFVTSNSIVKKFNMFSLLKSSLTIFATVPTFPSLPCLLI